MVKKKHLQVIEVIIPRVVKLNIPFRDTPDNSSLKKVQLDGLISQ
jgi:hypothetical protein